MGTAVLKNLIYCEIALLVHEFDQSKIVGWQLGGHLKNDGVSRGKACYNMAAPSSLKLFRNRKGHQPYNQR